MASRQLDNQSHAFPNDQVGEYNRAVLLLPTFSPSSLAWICNILTNLSQPDRESPWSRLILWKWARFAGQICRSDEWHISQFIPASASSSGHEEVWAENYCVRWTYIHVFRPLWQQCWWYDRTLVGHPYSSAHETFLMEGNITHYRILVNPNKETVERSPDTVIARVLEILVNKNNHPVLVHCNKGKVSYRPLCCWWQS